MIAAVITLAAGYPALIALALLFARAGVVRIARPATPRKARTEASNAS